MIIRFLLPGLLALASTLSLVAQSDNASRARPALERGHEYENEKREWYPYLHRGSPINTEFGLFLNSNTIVEAPNFEAPQNESSIAVSPVDPSFLIASAVDARPGAHVYLSYDGGRTWSNKDLGSVPGNWQSGNDPSVAFDHLGNAYVMYGAFPRPYSGESGVYVAKSTDKGETWQAHIVVIEHRGTMTPDSAFEDKYYIEVDRSVTSPYRGWMYTPWKRVTDRDSATEIVFTRSTDGGQTWSTPVGVSPRKPGTSKHITFGQSFPLVRSGPNGELYAVWNDGPLRSIGFSKSTDGGNTWSAPNYPVSGYEYLGTERYLTLDTFRVDTIDRGTPNERYDTTDVIDTTDRYHVLKETFRAETYPTLAVDNSNSSRRGWIYLAWSSNRFPDILFIRSTDGGQTWSPQKTVQSETRGDQWWPWIGVDETNGDVAVMYSDSRNDPENVLIDQYVSYSSNGGDTWIDRRATDAYSDFRDNPYVNRVFAGDYSGLAFHDGIVYPSFLDTRDDNDVYTVVVKLRQPYPVENLRVRTRLEDLGEAKLTWTNPPLETLYGLPVVSYTLVVERDGVKVAELPAGTTEFEQNGLTIGQEYEYGVRVAVGQDTSVVRYVTFRAGGAKEPLAPALAGLRQFEPTVEFDLRVPAVRADSITPLTNLSKIRVYRDGAFLKDVERSPSDTGMIVTITDSPPEIGYYRYTFSTIDDASPANESRRADTVIVFSGTLGEYDVSFDGADPRFLVSDSWALTTQIALSPPNSLTDSPNGDYRSRRSSSAQIYPFVPEVGMTLRFSHICIVLPGDTAVVEISVDTGRTWQVVAQYDNTMHPGWEDRTAAPGDWVQEEIGINVQDQLVLTRFRLATSTFGNADGWYVDDIAVREGITDAVGDNEGTIATSINPNPAGESAIVSYDLAAPSSVRVVLYDVVGRELIAIDRGEVEAGRGYVTLDLSALPKGVYLYEVVTEAGVARGKIVRR